MERKTKGIKRIKNKKPRFLAGFLAWIKVEAILFLGEQL